MKMFIGVMSILLTVIAPVWADVSPPLPQPVGATRVYTQWELHMRQVYRADTDSNREFGDAGSGGSGGDSSGSSAGATGGDSGGSSSGGPGSTGK